MNKQMREHWEKHNAKAGQVPWRCHCNLCGKKAEFMTLTEASNWVADHGCNYGQGEKAQ